MKNLQQWFLPPGISKEAEQMAQRILDTLSGEEEPLSDFVALQVAIEAFLYNRPFPEDGVGAFYRVVHGIEFPFNSWEECEAGLRCQIAEMSVELVYTNSQTESPSPARGAVLGGLNGHAG